MVVTNILLYFFKDWRMVVLNKLFNIWANVLFTYLETYFPNPVYVSYDPEILKMNKSIIISNHTSDYDWLFLMVILYRMGRFKDMCIMLKQELQEVPVFGHAMNVLGFIFLVRNIEYDKDIIHKGVMKLKNKDSYDLLIFPEGTYITPKTYKRTMDYLEKNKMYVNGELYKPKNSLAPKTTGFNLLLDDLKDDIDGVIDVTMLTTPYTQYPHEVHTFKKIFLEESGELSSTLLLDYIPSEKVKPRQLLPL
ncbi:Lysocardiolipin acyltransferase [Nosema bombycis CQ1]|uniref:Lysocardiolipin acyltransferase n=1 Tax=Nosema bombycis (strain CQ1 / CVCC 102059) TaxID=578461 RepID=R0MJ03_NOSB1|nr:Lysocardiolipin acyltransferase [Nosema bombycis CQ1]|eukprot:EOB14195.1 Lysocardiolipin acyltransferase [Nosema bombycis CQ1]